MSANVQALADSVFSAVRVYVGNAIGKAVAGLSDNLQHLEHRLDTLPAPVKGDPGDPGVAAEIDYDRIAKMLQAMVDAIPRPETVKGDPGDPGRSVTLEDVAPLVREAVAALPPAAKGDPGVPAEIDYDRVGSLLKAMVDALPTPTKGDPGAPGADAVVDYDRLGNVIAVAVEKEVGKLPPPAKGEPGDPGKNADPVDYWHIDEVIKANVAAAVKDVKLPEPAAPDEGALVAKVLALIPPAEPIHPDTVRVMVAETARDELAKQIAALPKPENGKNADPRETAEMVETAVARQFEVLRPHIKGEPGAQGIGVDGIVLEHDEDTGVARLKRADGEVIGELRGIPHEAGIYERGKAYRKGAIATYGGSAFIARCDTSAPIGGSPPSPDWRMLTQRGRDAR